jgi:phosphatidate cytidylyltransferase
VLKERVLTALVLVAVLLGVMLGLPPVATVWLLTVLVLVGAWEWAGFIRTPSMGKGGWPARLGFVVLIGVLLLTGWWFVLESAFMRPLMLVAVIWWFIAFLWILVAPDRVHPLAAAIAGVLALVPCWLALVYFATHTTPHAGWVLFTLALVWAADTGAYFAGRFLGKVPLAPRVSPKKTWEGVIGGLIVSGGVAAVGGSWLGVNGFPFISLCVAVAAISVVGDLTESMLKRAAGLKDSGSIFPGHGGVLDRIDSVTAAAPTLALGLYGLGVLT